MTTTEFAPAVEYLDLAGFRMAYREWGSPQATHAVVLVHGITSSSLSWVRVAPALADRFRVVAMDLKGHGDSARPSTGYALQDQAREVDGLCSGLGLEAPIVIGHSWGGAISLVLAATAGSRVRRLVLEDPAIGQRSQDPAERAARRDGYAATVGLSPEAASAQVRANVAPGWTEVDVAGKIDAVVKTSPDAVGAVFDTNPGWALHDLLPRLSCPTLLLRAPVEQGGIVDDEAVALAEANPHVRVVTVAKADHNIHRGQFDTFMAELERFLAEP
jgi:pimeloyl-ACP methyl ester carboxylesterase